MPTCSITTTYSDGSVLTKAHLDEITDGIETFLNTGIDSDNIAAGGVTTACLASTAVTAAKIGTGAVETAKIADDAVTAAKLADDATTDGNRAVTTNHIRDSAVTTAKIADSNVTTDKIANSNVTTAKIADGNVTIAKLAAVTASAAATAGNFAICSTSCGAASTASTSYTDVPNLSITIVTTGRPVLVGLVSDSTAPLEIVNAASRVTYVRFVRDGTTIAEFRGLVTGGTQVYIPATLWHIDLNASAGGPYTYKAQFKVDASPGGEVAYLSYAKIIAFEL